MNLLITCIGAMLLFAPMVFSKQCRQVTVCSEEHPDSSKGMQGECCALKLQLTRKLEELKAMLSPTSCHSSPVYGRQTLQSGEEVFCEDGWTVFHKRFNLDVNFNRNWNEYKQGFGDLDGDFWLGLDKIHNLTKDRGCKLRVDLWKTGNDVHTYAIYSDFYVGDESDNYRLQVNGYNGTAGDWLNYHNNMQFSTKDRDNDQASYNCAYRDGGGWWYNACDEANLNEPPPLEWINREDVQKATMKVRCDELVLCSARCV